MGRTEKKVLIALIIVFILLPFAVAQNFGEIFSRVGPLWLSYPIFVWYWAYAGEPIWRTILACYGISSVGVVLIYFGINLLQEIDNLKEGVFGEITSTPRPSSFTGYLRWTWIYFRAFGIFFVFTVFYWPRRIFNSLKKFFLGLAGKLGLTKLFRYKNNRHGKLTKILSGGSPVFIFLVFIVPIPVVGLIAIAAMKIKRIKYGLWYLLAANTIEIVGVVYLAYSGINWSFIDWFLKF